MVHGVDNLLGLFHRAAGLKVDPGLVSLAKTDGAFRGVRTLEAGQETAMTHLLVAVAVAIHLIESIGDHVHFLVDIPHLWIGEEPRIENGRGPIDTSCARSSQDYGAWWLVRSAGRWRCESR